MKKWMVTMSRDGVDVHAETLIESDIEPDFWTLYNLAESHGCAFFECQEVTE